MQSGDLGNDDSPLSTSPSSSSCSSSPRKRFPSLKVDEDKQQIAFHLEQKMKEHEEKILKEKGNFRKRKPRNLRRAETPTTLLVRSLDAPEDVEAAAAQQMEAWLSSINSTCDESTHMDELGSQTAVCSIDSPRKREISSRERKLTEEISRLTSLNREIDEENKKIAEEVTRLAHTLQRQMSEQDEKIAAMRVQVATYESIVLQT